MQRRAAAPPSREPRSHGLENSASRRPACPRTCSSDAQANVPPFGVLDDHERHLCGVSAAIRVAAAQLTEFVDKVNTLRHFTWAGRPDSGAPASGLGGIVRRTARRARRRPRAAPCPARTTSDFRRSVYLIGAGKSSIGPDRQQFPLTRSIAVCGGGSGAVYAGRTTNKTQGEAREIRATLGRETAVKCTGSHALLRADVSSPWAKA